MVPNGAQLPARFVGSAAAHHTRAAAAVSGGAVLHAGGEQPERTFASIYPCLPCRQPAHQVGVADADCPWLQGLAMLVEEVETGHAGQQLEWGRFQLVATETRLGEPLTWFPLLWSIRRLQLLPS